MAKETGASGPSAKAAGVQIQSEEPEQVRTRIDPSRRENLNSMAPTVDGTPGWMRRRNSDPNRHYVLVSRSVQGQVDDYLDRGYEIERRRADGVELRGSRVQDGQEITSHDCVLMSIPAEKKRDIDLYGDDGNSGKMLADELERRIFDRNRTGIDGLGRFQNGYVEVHNDSGFGRRHRTPGNY